MSEKINVQLTKSIRFWRYQGDILNGDISQTTLTVFLQNVWTDDNGEVYKVEDLPSITGTPEELGLLPEFQAIQAKLNSFIS
ncbi:hypothetical protein [Nostoc sp. FACHB-110]|uniref:hypothetical protein n=1 Tax=Nostoc sp. FACHB-110 TaxID=2692834 RepID=UPI00168686CB|nr:hypothetical protein [Nostoc sp. FACHB-110]MBD2437367.1 hypothetical protein [Nostoc sp. FACHB-110]